MLFENIKYIDEVSISEKRVLVRLDCDVSMNIDNEIADDIRIRANVPTLKYLLKDNNKIICIAKFNRPDGRDEKYSLKPIQERLQSYLPDYSIRLINDFQTEDKSTFEEQNQNEILLLENIRFYDGEEINDPDFSKQLADLVDLYVNDAFAMCHRVQSSVVGVPQVIPGYGGLSLKKEIVALSKIFEDLPRPILAIVGGAKIATKINVLDKFLDIADDLIIGGGLANTFLKAQGYKVGDSLFEYEEMSKAKTIMFSAAQKNAAIHLPLDAILGCTDPECSNEYEKKIHEIINEDEMILDIGPETEAKYGNLISNAGTIIWNGPMGYVEKASFRRGTDFIFYSIADNPESLSIIGGGDTLAAISNKEHLEDIDHISTGGGAMLEFIEKRGHIPGIDVLNQ